MAVSDNAHLTTVLKTVDTEVSTVVGRLRFWVTARYLFDALLFATLAGLAVVLIFVGAAYLGAGHRWLHEDFDTRSLGATAMTFALLLLANIGSLTKLLLSPGALMGYLDRLNGDTLMTAWWENRDEGHGSQARRWVFAGLATETLENLRRLDPGTLRVGTGRRSWQLVAVLLLFVPSVSIVVPAAAATLPVDRTAVAGIISSVAEELRLDPDVLAEPAVQAVAQTLDSVAIAVLEQDLPLAEVERLLSGLIEELGASTSNGNRTAGSQARLSDLIEALSRGVAPTTITAADNGSAAIARQDGVASERARDANATTVPTSPERRGDRGEGATASGTEALGIQDWEAAGGDEYFPPEVARALDRQRATLAGMRVTLPPGGDPGGAGFGESIEAGSGRQSETGLPGTDQAGEVVREEVVLPTDPGAESASRVFDSGPGLEGEQAVLSDPSSYVPSVTWNRVVEQPRYVETVPASTRDAVRTMYGREEQAGANAPTDR